MKLIWGFIGKNRDFKLIEVVETEKAPGNKIPKEPIRKTDLTNYIISGRKRHAIFKKRSKR